MERPGLVHGARDAATAGGLTIASSPIASSPTASSRCGSYRVDWFHSVLDHLHELARRSPVFVCSNVGAETNLHSHSHRLLKNLFVMLDDSTAEISVVFCRFGEVNRQRWTPERPVLDEKLQRLVVHQHSVLDRAHAASNRVLRSFASVSVSSNVAMPSRRFCYYCFHVFKRDLAERFKRNRINMTESAGRIELDPVGAVFHLAANLGDHRIARIRERRRFGNLNIGIQTRVIHMSAGDRQRVGRHKEAGTGNNSAIDAVSNRDVGEARAFAVQIAHGRETGFQIPFRGRDRLHRPERLRLGDDGRRASLVFGLEHHVSVTIDQPRQHGISRKVYHLGSIRNLQTRPDLVDPVPAHDYDGVLSDRTIDGIDQPPAPYRRDRVRLS